VDEDSVLLATGAGILANDTDTDGDPLSAALVSGPSHGSLHLAADGSFRYAPGANYHGPDSFTYKSEDGIAGSNVATVSITVRSVNDVPVAVNDTFVVNEDETLAVGALGVLANDSDEDGAGPLGAVLVTGASHGVVSLTVDGGFAYTPNRDFNGLDTFTYRSSDGDALSNVAIVTVTVNAVNDPPVAVSQSVTTERRRPITVTLAADDQEGSALTYRIVTRPMNGTLSGTAPNLQYTPKHSFLGSDRFTVVVNDGAADSNIATVSIRVVKDLNDPPVAFDQAVRADEDESEDIKLRAKDPEGTEPLDYIILTAPSHGTLSGTGKELEYTPHANFQGQDSFTFKVSDQVHHSNVATVIITVRADDRRYQSRRRDER
jgi:VCBS repeat-containing protein